MSDSDLLVKYRKKLLGAIEEGSHSAEALVNRIQSEMVTDKLVDSRGLSFAHVLEQDGHKLYVDFPGGPRQHYPSEVMSDWAIHQAAERADVNKTFIDNMQARGEFGYDLIADTITKVFKHDKNKKVMVRSVKGQARGIVSDQFKRLDSRPIMDSFVSAVQEQGAEPIEGYGSDTRFKLRAVFPHVWEPFPGEVIAIGISLANSDYGNGALSIRVFICRCHCINMHDMEELLREVHLGSRLSAVDIQFSKEAINAETKASMLAARDIVRSVFHPRQIEDRIELVRLANAKKIDDTGAYFKRLTTTVGLLKAELEAVKEVFVDGGVEELPPGNTVYRMSNAISWVARNRKGVSAERRMELEQAAGKLLLKAA